METKPPAAGTRPSTPECWLWMTRRDLVVCCVLLALTLGGVATRHLLCLRDDTTLIRPADVAHTVDINAAPAWELEELPGIGPALAEAIVRHREDHGPFASARDLLAVHGMGPSKLRRITPQIHVATPVETP